jgi:DNA-binding SARP family transcriptional activator
VEIRELAHPLTMIAGQSPMLSVSALGGFDLSLAGARVEVRSRKAQGLLVYLLLNPIESETRERLCGLMWSEFPEDKARASLRQVLHGLRETLEPRGFRGLILDRDAVRLERQGVAFDVAGVLDALGRRTVPDILISVEKPPEALLAGFDGLDAGFDVWLAIQRRLLRERLERALLSVVDGGGETTIAAATALVNIDPTNEFACRCLMEGRAARGEVSAALKVYKELWDHLDEEYDMEPSPETQALAVRLKSEPAVHAKEVETIAHSVMELADTHMPSLAAKPSAQRPVVVAPFDLRGVNTDFNYLVSGLRQDLIAKLVRFREWVIIDGQHVPGEAGATFAQRWPEQIWIDGFVMQTGASLKITISVREQPAATLIWSESFRFNLDSWFEVEREVLSRIAATMNLHISTARLIASSGAPDVSLEIYDRWLRGQSIIMNWKPERDQAREIYGTILSQAPNFSPAHSSLAQLESMEHLALPGVFRSAEREAAGLEYSKRAVRLDPFDSRAHLALGWASAMNGHFDQAYAAFTTALELNENDPWTINSAALGCGYCGDVYSAVATIQQSLDFGLKPTPFHAAYQGAIRFLSGDFARAVQAYDQAGDIIGDLAAWKAASLAHLGRIDEAQMAIQHFIGHVRSRWMVQDAATEERIAAWFLHCFPIRNRQTWESLRDGVVRAGLSVPAEQDIPRHP